MKLSDLMALTAPVSLTYGTETVHLTVRPQAITSESILAFTSLNTAVTTAEELAAQLKSIADMFLALVASWDMKDEEDQPLPLTTVGLPLKFMNDVIQAAMRSVGEGQASEGKKAQLNGATSGAIS